MGPNTFKFKMAISAKVVGGKSYDIENPPSPEMTFKEYLDFIKKTLIHISIDALQSEQEKGFDKKPIVLVDGKKGVAVSSVRPLGKVEFISTQRSGAEIVQLAYDKILELSPIQTGTYIEGNFVLYNGSLIATTRSQLIGWLKTHPTKPKDVFILVNVLPYARSLERKGITYGKTSVRMKKSTDKRRRSGSHVLAANGAYFLAHRSVKRVYKGNAYIKFDWISGSTLGIQNAPAVTKSGKKLRTTFAVDKDKKGKRKKIGGAYLYPYIRIALEGVT